MSSYLTILTDLELSTLASFIAPAGKVQVFADKLKRINIQSFNFRYDEQTPITECVVSFRDDSIDFRQLSENWEYQSCEDDSNSDYHIMSAYIESLHNPSASKQRLMYTTPVDYN